MSPNLEDVGRTYIKPAPTDRPQTPEAAPAGGKRKDRPPPTPPRVPAGASEHTDQSDAGFVIHDYAKSSSPGSGTKSPKAKRPWRGSVTAETPLAILASIQSAQTNFTSIPTSFPRGSTPSKPAGSAGGTEARSGSADDMDVDGGDSGEGHPGRQKRAARDGIFKGLQGTEDEDELYEYKYEYELDTSGALATASEPPTADEEEIESSGDEQVEAIKNYEGQQKPQQPKVKQTPPEPQQREAKKTTPKPRQPEAKNAPSRISPSRTKTGAKPVTGDSAQRMTDGMAAAGKVLVLATQPGAEAVPKKARPPLSLDSLTESPVVVVPETQLPSPPLPPPSTQPVPQTQDGTSIESGGSFGRDSVMDNTRK